MSAPQQPAYGPPPGYGPPQEDTVVPVLMHLSYFALTFIGPIVGLVVARNDPGRSMLRHHAAEALNFHLTLLLVWVGGFALLLAGLGVPSVLLVVLAAVLFVGSYLAGIVLAVVAAVAASRREPYRYPFTLRLVR